ncbi:MAG: hypothetical protein KGN84_12340, partial [Acidobacteriota bacterium]|nr:hypothetical protein [Acidobacteriota bacterium]
MPGHFDVRHAVFARGVGRVDVGFGTPEFEALLKQIANRCEDAPVNRLVRFVVDELAAQGAVFVESLDEVPDGAITIFSAHGVAPEVWEEARKRKLRVIDATCPLVTKVHIEVIRYARENYSIILIGHRNHDEVIGTYGEAPGSIH